MSDVRCVHPSLHHCNSKIDNYQVTRQKGFRGKESTLYSSCEDLLSRKDEKSVGRPIVEQTKNTAVTFNNENG